MIAPKANHVLIVGAGITGMLVAHGLQKAGIPFDVFEAEDMDTFRPREWTMGVHWGLPLMEALLPQSIVDRFIANATVDSTLDYKTPPQNGSRIYDGVTGKVLKEIVSDGKLVRFSRRKLRALLSEGIDVKFGHVLKEVTYGKDTTVSAQFANGHSYTGSIIIGTDGARSMVRNLAFEGMDESRLQLASTDAVMVSAVFSYGDAEKARFVRTAHPVWSLMISPGVFVFLCIQDAADPGKPEDWKYDMKINWYGEKQSELTSQHFLQLVKQKCRHLKEPFHSAVQWIPEGVEFKFMDISYWISKPWDTKAGRVTLAGDALHPMPPYRGQGLNLAIQDVYSFVEAMKRIQSGSETQEDAIRAYSDEAVDRGSKETILSNKNGEMMLSYHDFLESPYMKFGLSKQHSSQT